MYIDNSWYIYQQQKVAIALADGCSYFEIGQTALKVTRNLNNLSSLVIVRYL